MVTKADIEFINLVTEEKNRFLDQDWHELRPAEEKRLKIFGLFEKAEIKDCIEWYIMTGVEQKYIDYEKQKLRRLKK